MNKIDSLLLDKISVLNKSENDAVCFVWTKHFESSKEKIEQIFGKNCIIYEYPFLNAFGLKISKHQLLYLSEFDWVEYVSSIQIASVFMEKSRKDLSINDLHNANILGAGTCVAVIDTGCFPHLDFVCGHNRIVYFKDFVNSKQNYYDDNGHGTFVAGVIAGNGLIQNGRYSGIAPACNLVILKALDHKGETQVFHILEAMQWIIDNAKKYNIRVVCMSFGSIPLQNNDPLVEGAKRLWENGIVVVCACGNDGPNSKTIKSPGVCPNIITVGSADIVQDLSSISVAPFSSRGPAFDFIKPDIIAPGVDIVSTSNNVKFYTTMSGTSVSTPFVAGVCALLIGENPFLTPNMVKSLLMTNATFVNDDKNSCGSGFLNVKDIFKI